MLIFCGDSERYLAKHGGPWDSDLETEVSFAQAKGGTFFFFLIFYLVGHNFPSQE